MTTEERLKDVILAQYKNMSEFAEVCGIKYQTLVSIINRGVANAGIQNVIKICQALGISADAIAEGEIVFIEKAEKPEPSSLEDLFAETFITLRSGRLTYCGKPLTIEDETLLDDYLTVIMELLKKRTARQNS